jgi:hypothetical protein
MKKIFPILIACAVMCSCATAEKKVEQKATYAFSSLPGEHYTDWCERVLNHTLTNRTLDGRKVRVKDVFQRNENGTPIMVRQ